jgi:TNF receptor-associated protein 1
MHPFRGSHFGTPLKIDRTPSADKYRNTGGGRPLPSITLTLSHSHARTHTPARLSPLLPSPPPPPNSSELVSNASDALEKLRHKQVAGDAVLDPTRPLSIRITTNEADNTITISDTGVGMDKPELIDHLGTIARSGSKAFMQKLRDQGGAAAGGSLPSDTGANIIGQFGVGFYSAFMVSDSVTVYAQSAVPDSQAYAWTSVGDGSYEIAPATDVGRGCKVVLKLKETCRDFSNPATVKDILTRYSNFVNFPIYLNDKQVNTVTAIWAASKADVTDEQYTEFYKYKSGDFEAPLFRLHFAADAPTSIKALLYVGQSHDEKYGMGRMKPGVDLYSRKVLIQASSSHIMPDWLRFVHGVVDSEDIPLNISRESMQDSALMKRIKAVLTRRVLRFLDSEARRDPAGYNTKFFPEFGAFLKEGCVTDATYSQDIAKLLRFESSSLPAGSLTSLDEYISRMPVGQTSIYYLVAPHRGIAEASPYMEAFRGGNKGASASSGAAGEASVSDVEVLFLYSPIDDFAMNNLREFGGRKLVTAETAELDPATLQGVKKEGAGAGAAAGADAGKAKDKGKEAEAESAAPSSSSSSAASPSSSSAPALTDAQVQELGAWMVSVLPKRLTKVRSTTRLRASPAVVTDHESASLRRMMRMVEASAGKEGEALRLEAHMLPKQTLEVNPSHPIITRLHAIRTASPDLALIAAEQLVDNAMVAAGLVDDSRVMLPRLTALLERALGVAVGEAYPGAAALEGKRWVPPKEAEERRALEAAEKAADEATRATLVQGGEEAGGKRK